MNRAIAQAFLTATKQLVRLDARGLALLREGNKEKALDTIAPLALNILRPFVESLTLTIRNEARNAASDEYLKLALSRNRVVKAHVAPPDVLDDEIRRDVAKLVVDITAQQRKALKKVIERRFDSTSRNDRLVSDIKAVVGLTEREAVAVMTLRDSLEERGLPLKRIDNEVTQYSDKLTQLRAQRIARTETVRVQVEGKRAAFKAARRDGILGPNARLEWVASDNCCGECRRLNGMTTSLDGTFTTSYGKIRGAPAHPNCECDVRATEY